MPARDAISMLKEDHKKVKEMLSQLEKTSERGAKTRERLMKQIETEIKIHSQLEEELFYPAFMEAAEKRDDEKMFHEASEEHHVVDMVLPEVNETEFDSVEFAAKAKVLKDLVEHHIEEEEKQMFPRAKKSLDTEQLKDLGQQIERRKMELQGKIR